ncbi:MAG: Asp-tRNA(Asn)/Glu-tRNA(Gln) amidotransferase subunit GatC [Spirochaetales bacterium]
MDKSELQITADLALLDLSPEEEQRLEQEVAQLLEYFSVMNSIDVSGLEPTTHALQRENRLRDDSSKQDESIADDILEQAPDTEDRFFAIPNVL